MILLHLKRGHVLFKDVIQLRQEIGQRQNNGKCVKTGKNRHSYDIWLGTGTSIKWWRQASCKDQNLHSYIKQTAES